MYTSIKIQRILIVFLAVIIVLSSCVSTRKLEYVRSKQDQDISFQTAVKEIQRIKPGDQLYIRVSSFDDISYNFFSTQAENNQMNYGNEIAVALISYTVNDSGKIYFPILESIYLKDLTLEEATIEMQKRLSEYFNQPTVIIKFVNKKITILGEVRSPGHYFFTKERLNILEAIGIAGDITIHGNKKHVMLIREEEDKIYKERIDLTDSQLLSSPDYFVHSGDIIYVRSRITAMWSITASTYSLILSSITTFLLVLSYTQT